MNAYNRTKYESWIFDDRHQVKTLTTLFSELNFAEETHKWRTLFPADSNLLVCSVLVPISENRFSQLIALRLSDDTANKLNSFLKKARFEKIVIFKRGDTLYHLPYCPQQDSDENLLPTASYASYSALYHLVRQYCEANISGYGLKNVKTYMELSERA